jgi:hypothetical protein
MPDDHSRESARPSEETPHGTGGAHGEPGSALPDPVRGVELAGAIDALHDVLAQVWRDERQGPARLDVTDVEVSLPCVVTSTGEDPAGIQWRVLSPGREGSEQAASTLTLKIRFAPRPDEPGGALAEAEQSASHPAGEASEARSGGSDRTLYMPGGSDGTASFAPAAGAEEMTLVRVCLSEVDRTRMVLEVGFAPIPRDDYKEFASKSLDKVVEGVEEYAAQRITDGPWTQLSQLWITKNPGGFGADADAVQALKDGLHQCLLGNPAEMIASGLGLPDPAGLGQVVDVIPILAIDRPLNAVKRCFELVGILVGVATGLPPLACASLKLLVHDEVTRALTKGIKEVVRTAMTRGRQPQSEATPTSGTPLRKLATLPTVQHGTVGDTSQQTNETRSPSGNRGSAEIREPVPGDPDSAPATSSEKATAGRIAERASTPRPCGHRNPGPAKH